MTMVHEFHDRYFEYHHASFYISDEKENAANLLSVTNGDAASSRRGSFLSEDATKRDTMVMVVDQSEETSSTGKKKTKKGKKVKIAGKAAHDCGGGGGMTNGGGEDAGAATGAVQDGAVIDDPETLERFEVGQVGALLCSANVFINAFFIRV